MTCEDYKKIYESKKGTVQDALDMIHSGDVIWCSNNYNEPETLFGHLHEIADRVDNVIVYKSRIGRYPFMMTPGMNGHINCHNYFYGPSYREAHKLLNASFIPVDLPNYYRMVNRHKPCNIFTAQVSPMTEDGKLYVGMNQTIEYYAIKDAVEQHKKIIVEVNPNLTYMNGSAYIPVEAVTLLYEVNTPEYCIGPVTTTPEEDKIGEMAKDVVCITAKGRPVKAKTLGQQRYMKAILKNTITIGVGPAGTGKTYLAVAAAVAAFREKAVNRIILTRPAVEAGERLGFLPGDLQNKVDPYLRPLYDALYDMLGAETYQKYLERGNIEVAPLAYMRGRTLDDSFIILDEAQNTTREQMKMFLTRLGFGSKIVITGDITQIDLPSDKVSGLKDAVRILDNVPDIAICRLTASDVVRHALVQRIIAAYETAEHSAKNVLPGQKKVYRRKP